VLNQFFQPRLHRRRNVLIVGSDVNAVNFAIKLSKLKSELVGFIDERWEFDEAPSHYKDMRLGRPSDISKVLRETVVDEVAVLSSAYRWELEQEVVDACFEQGIKITRPPGSAPINNVTRRPILPLAKTTQRGMKNRWTIASKRLIDIIFSGIAIVALLPLFIIIALAVKLSSKGPVIFSQDRLGVGKRPFRIFKFRTMVPNAESLMASIEHLNEATGAHFKLQRDPRVTPIGAWLRKTSLDELPQLFNVLLGDMSLVGPRPIVMRDYRGIALDRHRRRFTVKPGITCLWQVGGRSSIDFDRWMELDLDYIDRWSLRLDLLILLKTVPVVIRGSGAM